MTSDYSPTLENVEDRILLTTYSESVLGELGGTMSTAGAITLDSTGAAAVTGAISPVGDVDMMRIVATASGTMTATMSGPLANKVTAYDSRGTLIGYVSAAKAGQTESYSFSVKAGQAYYVKAANANSGTGSYAMTFATAGSGGTVTPPPITPTTPAVPSGTNYVEWTSTPSDLGGTRATALPVTQNADGSYQLVGNIATSADLDDVSFIANTTGQMTVTMKAMSGSKIVPMVSLLDPSGNVVGTNSSTGNTATFTAGVTAGQQYIVRMAAVNGTSGYYQTNVSTVAATPTTPPPPTTPTVPTGTDYVEWQATPSYIGDTAATATPVTLHTDGSYNLMGSIGGATDVDIVKFTAPVTGHLAVDMGATTGSTVSCDVDILDASGNVLGAGTYAAGGDAQAAADVTAGQTYYIQMAGTNSTTGYYQVGVTTTVPVTPPPPTPTTPTVPSGTDYVEWTSTPNDLGETRATATPVTQHDDGSYQLVGNVANSTDVDNIGFTANVTGQMTVNMAGMSGSTITPMVSLLDINGNVVGTNTGTGNTATFTAPVTAGQQYFVRMTSANSTSGYYQTNISTVAGTVTPPPVVPPPTSTGPQYPAHPTYLTDGSGYGVNAPNGPDADPNDPTVNTYQDVINKYGTMANFVQHLGYHPLRIITGVPDAATAKPGDCYLIPGGTYGGSYSLALNNLHGTAQDPIIVMSMPGQQAVFTGTTEGISAKYSSYLTFDNLTIKGPSNGQGYGILFWEGANNLTFNHINESGYMLGLEGMQGLNNITVENSAFHDNSASHGIYFGARDKVNSNIYVLNNLLYNNNNTGIQHNGRVTNLVVSGNTIYGNGNVGISLLQGVSNSTFSNNLIYDNKNPGITITTYDDTNTGGIYSFDQVNNLFENNTIWVGQYGPDGSTTPSLHAAFHFSDSTAAQAANFSATIRNNTIVTYAGPDFLFSRANMASNMTITGNTIYRASGPDDIMEVNGQKISFSNAASAVGSFTGNTFAQPNFTDVSYSYWSTPSKFNFAIKQ